MFQHTHCLTFLEQVAPTTSDLPKMAFLPVAETWGTVTGFCWQPAASMLSSRFQHSLIFKSRAAEHPESQPKNHNSSTWPSLTLWPVPSPPASLTLGLEQGLEAG